MQFRARENSMRHTAFYIIAGAFLCAVQTAPAQAAAPTRVFVAAQGSDSNPCTFALPCRTFQKAHDTVAAGGEIDVLDPAGYGALTIIKAISIQGHGFSGITATSGAVAITINAGISDKINLSGLLIEGAGTGLEGIQFNSGRALNVQDSIIRNFVSAGIDYFPQVNNLTSVSHLNVSRTLVSDI